MERATLTENDEGKSVVDYEGEKIGIVKDVRGNTAYVDPDPDAFEKIKSKMNWGEADEDTYPVDANEIEAVTDDELRLRNL